KELRCEARWTGLDTENSRRNDQPAVATYKDCNRRSGDLHPASKLRRNRKVPGDPADGRHCVIPGHEAHRQDRLSSNLRRHVRPALAERRRMENDSKDVDTEDALPGGSVAFPPQALLCRHQITLWLS